MGHEGRPSRAAVAEFWAEGVAEKVLGKWAELNAVQKIVELSFCLEERPVTFCFVLFSFVELVVQAQISGRSLAR